MFTQLAIVLMASAILIFEQIIRLLSSALTILCLAHIAGPELLGQYQLLLTCCALIVPAANLGLNQIVMRQTDHLDKSSQFQVVQACVVIRLIVGIGISGLAFSVFGHWYPWFLSSAIFLAAIIYFLIQAFSASQLFEIYLQYQGQIFRIAFAKILIVIVFFTAKVLSIVNQPSLTSLLWITILEACSVSMMHLVLFYKFKSSQDYPSLQMLNFAKVCSLVKPLLKRSYWLWASGLLALVYLKIDVLMIESMLGSAAVGIYSSASRLSELWYIFPASIALRFSPRLLNSYQSDRSSYRQMQRMLSKYFFLSALVIAILVTVTAPFFVPVLLGADFTEAILVLQLHIWAGCFIFIRYLVSQHLLLSEQESQSLLSHGVGALINVLLNYYLIPMYGLKGAAIATLISYAYASFFFLLCSRQTRRELREFFCADLSATKN